MKWIRFIVVALVTGFFIHGLSTPLGPLPPLGDFFSPFTGFWQNNESNDFSSTSLRLKGLQDEVIVKMDDNLVPHIFAKNNHDLYFAQGYITAKYRLWQMEFEARAAAGRISEIVGARALAYDRQQRRFGMVYGAEQSVKQMEKDPQSKEAADAYSAGVNAWISHLGKSDYPVEFKLLHDSPEPWSNLKSALLLMFMSYDLAGYSDDFYMSHIAATYGMQAIDSLFTGTPYLMDPIIPANTPLDFTPLPIPPVPADYMPTTGGSPFDHQPNPLNGSNNWAVNGKKTTTGLPILCGDPHLGLNLPSLWFQIQLTGPDCNVCGVSFAGTPTVVIGFNNDIAWSETNVDADVLDWYSVKFKDASHSEYAFDNGWRPATKRIEIIKVRGQKDVIDTVIYTHEGPVVLMHGDTALDNNIPAGYAMRWLAHDGGMEMKALLLLNRARNYDDYVNALQYFHCPAQNFVYADNADNIAIWSNGLYPLKWKEQGKFLLDGTRKENDWQGWLPHDQDPHVKNPARNFVSSANQTPATAPYPYYLNWRFETYTRGHRINERLASMNHITADSMRMLQFDEKNLIAEATLPTMLSMLDQSTLNDSQKKIAGDLSHWNFIASADAMPQSVFSKWWADLKKDIWDDELGGDDMRYPETDVSIETVVQSRNKWWVDNKTTKDTETLQQLVTAAFIAATDTLSRHFGFDATQWNWAKVKDTHISHLLHIPAFSRNFVDVGGYKAIVNATGNNHGPSWRMIVELGKPPHAFGIYPGGQSGNPGSPFYDNMIDDWSKGLQRELVFLSSVNEVNKHILSTTTLQR